MHTGEFQRCFSSDLDSVYPDLDLFFGVDRGGSADVSVRFVANTSFVKKRPAVEIEELAISIIGDKRILDPVITGIDISS